VFDLSDPSSFSAPTATHLVPMPMKPKTGLPVIHLLNRPHPSRLRQAIAAGYDITA
jgi:hypothetical protein